MNEKRMAKGGAVMAALLLGLSGCVGPAVEPMTRTGGTIGTAEISMAERVSGSDTSATEAPTTEPAADESAAVREMTETTAAETASGTTASRSVERERITERVTGTTNRVPTPTPQPVVEPTTEEDFLNGAADFSVSLLRQRVSDGENLLLSPYAALSVLAMTANGAAEETQAQMERVLAGGMTIDRLNTYMRRYRRGLSSDETARLHTAGSIWMREDGGLRIEPSFLQTNTEFYGAEIRKAAFDDQTAAEINRWVSQQTDGMIDRMVERLSREDQMVLLSALAFEADWEKPYRENQVSDGVFRTADGTERAVEMMRSTEHRYMQDERAVGFLKDYAGGRYQFLALLPNEGISPAAYAASLTGEDFRRLVREAEKATVNAMLPAFDFACDTALRDTLRSLGMTDAFDERADFSRMSHAAPGLMIGQVKQKTFIQVSPQGTRAGAAASVSMVPKSAAPSDRRYTVTLDRPFLYGIVDSESGLPLFLGVMADPAEKTGRADGARSLPVRDAYRDIGYPASHQQPVILRSAAEAKRHLRQETAFDDRFFETQMLVCIPMEEGSGSIGHRVKSVRETGGTLRVDIERLIPEVGTCDMAATHILLTVPRMPLEPRQIEVCTTEVPY